MSKAVGYATDGPKQPYHVWEFERREPGEGDVVIEIQYAGICHSDIHTAWNEWGRTTYPLVAGHEILGKVTKVGSKVSKFAVGDLAGVGCMVSSCKECEHCKVNHEHHCAKGFSGTYNSTEQDKKTRTYGGYSNFIVVDQDFCLQISKDFKHMEGVAPLLCAGITTYSPLKKFEDKLKNGGKLGVVGLGGLGHMAVKIGRAMGADVTVFSTSASKEKDATALGAQHFVNVKTEGALKELAGKYDVLLDTVSAPHNYAEMVDVLKSFGVYIIVGAPVTSIDVSPFALLMKNKTLYGSLIGGIQETQEMLEFCAKHQIVSDVEVIDIDKIDEAYERTVKSDVKYRFVIDIDSLRKKIKA